MLNAAAVFKEADVAFRFVTFRDDGMRVRGDVVAIKVNPVVTWMPADDPEAEGGL